MAKKIGRPKIEIDLKLAEQLANIHCTIKEIGAVMNIPATTLQEREDFRLVYEKGLENGKASLRRTQFKLAQTHPNMAIFLGKNYLGQVDTPLIDQSSHLVKIIFHSDGKPERDNNRHLLSASETTSLSTE